MGLLRRKSQVSDLGPSSLLPAGDPGCWLVRATVATAAPTTVQLPVETPAQPDVRPARARLATLTANLSV